jgi:hypothetical protein
MATQQKRPSQNPSLAPEMPEDARRRDRATDDTPATVPEPDSLPQDGGISPPEDGGVAQHPIHDDDLEDLDAEDYEELTDEVAKVGIKGV